jgi:2-C-methyl-D-erythritol 4-phosphate cytidylyltransferase
MGNIHAILLAGGEGKRFGSTSPKQFLKLGGESLLQRSARRFREWGFLKQIVVVSKSDWIPEVELELSSILWEGDRIVEGGLTRHQSFLNGFHLLQKNIDDLVFIHDVARPFFLYSELDDLVHTTRSRGTATLAESCPDTIARGNLEINEILNRENIWLIKTPQMATVSMIQNFLDQTSLKELDSIGQEPTDLTSWAKDFGMESGIVETGFWNRKITNPGDLKLAESLLSSMKFLSSDLQEPSPKS